MKSAALCGIANCRVLYCAPVAGQNPPSARIPQSWHRETVCEAADDSG